VKLRAADLAVHLGDRWLFRELTATFAPGGFHAVIGPNGAGKSTLLRTLVGLHAATEGAVLLDDRPLLEVPRHARARALAYLPQHTPLYHDLRASEVVMLGRLPHLHRLRPPAAADSSRVEHSLRDVGVSTLADRPLSTLSGGERQRVMLARMLATEAPILVLDEPTTALDIGHALRFLDLLRRLADDGRTIVVALHDLDLADRFATDAVCLHGDAEGSFDHGPRASVIDPARLGPIFAVAMQRTPAGHLHVALPEA
jgi:iron complex transport system ATP-binding protein